MHCGLLGRKLGHSYSPAIHAMLADYEYKLYEKEPEELDAFLRTADFQGLNVTMPYKKAVVPYCDLLTPLAEELGSVNTLVRLGDGRLMGDNTDAWGFDRLLARVCPNPAGKKALVLGSGGASATVQAVLRLAGAEVVVISRSGPDNYDNLDRHADAQILVNTTPVGMYPNVENSPVELDALPRLEAVVDVVYNPVRTRLILDAAARSIPCASGLYMLVGQAVRASELWTGAEISDETMDRVYRTIGASMENIVLIGMPGCGKSTVGRLLAERLGRPFWDADAEIVKRIGDIPAYFAAHGEDAFRTVETEVLAELGKQSGLVIATGGGCVTREENYEHLHRNGRILWLRREIEKLPVGGRPVSQRDGVQALYEKRKPLYEGFADLAADNNDDIDETVEALLRVLS
ncbi:MAG: shikimate kinase [Clostridia bacterium]|nr:shikimate kinase [Clostridia bacterium]